MEFLELLSRSKQSQLCLPTIIYLMKIAMKIYVEKNLYISLILDLTIFYTHFPKTIEKHEGYSFTLVSCK